MKKLRWRVILMLIIINLASSLLSDLLMMSLPAEAFEAMAPSVVELIKALVRSGFTLLFFTLFVILGVREITAPVLKLAKAAGQIAGGDYDVELPAEPRRDEIGQLEKSFAVMVGELKSTEYMQKDFISNVSHEYKTPLAVITGYAKLLQKEDLPAPDRAQYAGFIAEEAERLSRMTSNILLLSKLENQSVQPVFSVFALDEQLRQALLLYLPRFTEKEITLDIDLAELCVRGNAELLMHVWTNLLDNAAKFTPRGGAVTVRARAEDARAQVSIADSGVGMDAATAARAFDQFYQGDSSRKASGNGLGLSLVRRVVQLHQGAVRVKSAPGAGAAFVVTLPLEA